MVETTIYSPHEVSDPLGAMEEFLACYQGGPTFFQNTPTCQIITPSVEVISPVMDPEDTLRFLESAIRTAYKSEDRTDGESHRRILKTILSSGHESTLEHVSLTYRIVTNRGVTHELVRHRIASYTQESTRYVSYGKHQPKVILPWHITQKKPVDWVFWADVMRSNMDNYLQALDLGWKPQEARGVLPNDLKTEIVTTMNLRSLRNFFKLRTAPGAHPDMQVIAREMLDLTAARVPLVFDDIRTDVQSKVIPA